MPKKYQVFVSSTFRDLAEERQDAIRSILDLGHIPAGMELFPASDTEQLSYIKKVIDECDYYVLIMGGRYGSLDADGISFTEREYDYAVETEKTVLAFPHGDLASIPVGKSETAERMQSNLEAFRQKVMTGRLVREWKSRDQLSLAVVKSLVHAMSQYPAVGWIRGDTAASEDALNKLNELRNEVAILKDENRGLRDSLSPKITNLASGSETIELRFSYTTRGPRGINKHEKTFYLSWDELFIAVATEMTVARSTGIISHYVSFYMKENKGATQDYKMYDTDAAVVKNQLSALGLIKVYVSKTLKDGSFHEFMQLTDLGRSKMSETLAVRTAKES